MNSLKDEVINLKAVVIKHLLDKNARLKVKYENKVAILESNHNDLLSMAGAIVFNGIPENVPDNT